MDSMGTRRPLVCKRLARYLQLEAQDKKNVDRTNEILSKQVNVGVLCLPYTRPDL